MFVRILDGVICLYERVRATLVSISTDVNDTHARQEPVLGLTAVNALLFSTDGSTI